MKQVMRTLPSVVRTYISEGRYTTTAQTLMAKYSLRIDQGGVLEKELLLLLMGIENPTEFTEALAKDAGLDPATVDSLVQDVNNQVFFPLRKEEQMQNQSAQTPPVPRPPMPPRPTTPLPARPATPTPTMSYAAPLPPKMAMPKAATLGDIVRQVTAPKQLADHEEPHIEFRQAAPRPTTPPQPMPAAPATRPAPPAASASVAPATHKETPVPQNLPGAMPQAAVPTPQAVTPPTPPRMPAPPPITSYSSDPYREPIDEGAA